MEEGGSLAAGVVLPRPHPGGIVPVQEVDLAPVIDQVEKLEREVVHGKFHRLVARRDVAFGNGDNRA